MHFGAFLLSFFFFSCPLGVVFCTSYSGCLSHSFTAKPESATHILSSTAGLAQKPILLTQRQLFSVLPQTPGPL